MLPRHRIYLVAFLFLGSVLPTTQAADQQPLTIDVINQTWKARRERLQAMRIELSVEITTSKLLLYPEEETPLIETSDYIPLTKEESEHLKKEQVINHARYSMLLDSPKMRYHYRGRFPTARLKETVSVECTCFSDGRSFTRLNQSQETPSIHILKASKASTLFNSLAQLPLRWTLLPGDPDLGETLEGFTVQAKTESIQNLDCTVLKKTDSEGTVYLWVAPRSHDYAVLKYEYHYAGKILNSCHVQYKNDKIWGQIPQSCEIKCLYGNEDILRDAYKYTFNTFHADANITDDEFQLNFPQGARVWDYRKRDSQGKVISYIVE
ncbi:MAG TPA: hypothetical protein DIT97_28960 [Gimesia maris]|uniref:Uncharacterized protein n=1 Tax=Gimesia maris TaxID=122 RepID=A0A3D3RE15_9PLAN|nr:hypothetical protein [Gimesia maris]|tara:strand:- start:1055 stop:2023 length:969 start_codon:yes stop_codon:yes gene_type:complete